MFVDSERPWFEARLATYLRLYAATPIPTQRRGTVTMTEHRAIMAQLDALPYAEGGRIRAVQA